MDRPYSVLVSSGRNRIKPFLIQTMPFSPPHAGKARWRYQTTWDAGKISFDPEIFSESKGVQKLFASSDCRFVLKLELRTVTALFSAIAMEIYSERIAEVLHHL